MMKYEDLKGLLGKFAGMTRDDLSKTRGHWNDEAGAWRIGGGQHWTENVAVQERINKKVSGDPNNGPFGYFINFLKKEGVALPLERCLTLGGGGGNIEMGLSKCNFSRRFDVYDIAEEALNRSKTLAEAEDYEHIFFKVADINECLFPPDTYDVVLGVASVHHFKRLEHVFSEVKKTLKPGGYFFLHDFVGPAKFQWTDKQLNVINSILRLLPEKYRLIKGARGKVKRRFRRPSIRRMNKIDPSEAVRSDEILKLLPEYFEVVEKKELGGAVIHLLLEGIAGNFDHDKAEDMKLLNVLFDLEDSLMELGEISSDFDVVIARNFA